jgi:uncharacterized membrane protein YfcA
VIGLALAFLLTGLIYATVGFGGGSTYNALLVLGGLDYRAVPAIALGCNILVVTVGSFAFWRAGHVPFGRAWPLFTLSVPMAWLGGRIVVPEIVFVGLLAAALIAAGLAMLWQKQRPLSSPLPRRASLFEAAIGGGLGFLAGVVGIGGGIFLAPVLHLTRWGGAKAIAGTCALFILANSLSGLAGQLSKDDGFDRLAAIGAHWPLFPAVLIGGAIGARLGSGPLSPRLVAVATALLILYVGGRLALRFFALSGV